MRIYFMMGRNEVTAAISTLEQSIATLDTWVLVFAALVAVGVVGEAVLGIRHWMLDGRLRVLRHIESQLHENEIAQLTNDTATANQRAVESALELAKFKAPRTLTEEQSELIINRLRVYAGQQYAFSVAEGQEPADLMCQLDAILLKARWRRHAPFGPISVHTDCGDAALNTLSNLHLRVSINAPKETMDRTDVLGNVLLEQGLKAQGGRDPQSITVPAVINIMIGNKT